MATCSAWKKPRARPHQAVHLSLSYKQRRLLFWSARSKIKRRKKILPWLWHKRPKSKKHQEIFRSLSYLQFLYISLFYSESLSRSGMNTKLELSLCYMTFPVVCCSFFFLKLAFLFAAVLTATTHFKNHLQEWFSNLLKCTWSLAIATTSTRNHNKITLMASVQ